MKTGDLVRWSGSDEGDDGLGIILKVFRHPDEHGDGEAEIWWMPSLGQHGHRGIYPARHRYIEIINESR